jgi:hypothetical protein
MVDLSHHIIFVKNSEFLKDQVLQRLYSKGLDKKCVFVKEKKESDKAFQEKVYTVPMFGPFSVGIIQFEDEYSNDAFDKWIDTVPEHAYLIFLFDRLPGRISTKVKMNVSFRDVLSEAENTEVLQNFLTIIGKKVSVSARKFLLRKMEEDPSKVLTILQKLASYTPHLFIDEAIITRSFEESLSAFEGPLAFWRSRGLEATRILNRLEYASFRSLYLRFLMILIQFKIAEGKSLGEKMMIIKAAPETIREFEDLVKPHTLRSLEARFLYYSAAFNEPKEVFIIKHLTAKF